MLASPTEDIAKRIHWSGPLFSRAAPMEAPAAAGGNRPQSKSPAPDFDGETLKQMRTENFGTVFEVAEVSDAGQCAKVRRSRQVKVAALLMWYNILRTSSRRNLEFCCKPAALEKPLREAITNSDRQMVTSSAFTVEQYPGALTNAVLIVSAHATALPEILH